MKRIVATGLAVCALGFGGLGFGVNATAQGVSLGAGYAMAMNGTADTSEDSKRIDVPDSGGGVAAARGNDVAAMPVSGSGTRPLDDVRRGDPGMPAAPTPKRPSYRWQSLVPGAIK